jgi:outer membrane murein-binding lipoprotein Lpp
MAKKILIGIMVVLSLLLTSCYPELSVQQYDELKEDLAALDIKRAELEAEVESLKADIVALRAAHQAANSETRSYIVFLEKMVSTQSSERILTGEFDVVSLVDSKDVLMEQANKLDGSKIIYYLELMDSDNESQTVAAYYKTMEYCFKEMKQILQ